MTSLEAESYIPSGPNVGISPSSDMASPVTSSDCSTTSTSLQLPDVTNEICIEEMETETSDGVSTKLSFPNDLYHCLDPASLCLDSHPASLVGQSAENVADNVQPAPAEWDGMQIGHPKTLLGTSGGQPAFQLVSDTVCCASDTAGLLQCRVVGFASPQEHLPSRNSLLILKNSDADKLCLQTSEVNNSVTESSFVIPSSQSCSNLLPLPKESTLSSGLSSTKMLYTNTQQKSSLLYNIANFTANPGGKNVSTDTTDYNKPMQSSQLPTTQAASDFFKKKTSYSNAVSPPNIRPTTTGSSPECGISIERLAGYSLESYAWAVSDVVGKLSITFIGRNPADESFVLIFLKTPEMANLLVSKGIWLRSRWLNVSYYQQPAVRLTVSGVLPFFPDTLIIDVLAPYGSSVYTMLRRIPAAVKSLAFKGISSFRREIYLFKKKDIVLPEAVDVIYLGISHRLELSTVGAKCFSCGSLFHSINKCKNKDNTELRSTGTVQTVSKDSHPQNSWSDAQTSTMKVLPDVGVTKQDSVQTLSVPMSCNTQFRIPVSTRTFFSQCNLAGLPSIKDIKFNIFSLDSSVGSPRKANLHHKAPSPDAGSSVDCTRVKPKNVSIVESPQCVINSGVADNSASINLQSKNMDHPLDPTIKKKKRVQFMNESFSKESTVKDDIHVQQVIEGQDTHSIESSTSGSMQLSNLIQVSSCPNKAHVVTNNDTLFKKKNTNLLQSHELLELPADLLQDAIGVAEEWCRKSKGLRPFSKKKLASLFSDTHPNLESLMMSALTVPKKYPSSSVKYKRIQELLSELKQQNADTRVQRVAKRKQPVV